MRTGVGLREFGIRAGVLLGKGQNIKGSRGVGDLFALPQRIALNGVQEIGRTGSSARQELFRNPYGLHQVDLLSVGYRDGNGKPDNVWLATTGRNNMG